MLVLITLNVNFWRAHICGSLELVTSTTEDKHAIFTGKYKDKPCEWGEEFNDEVERNPTGWLSEHLSR